MPIHLLPLFILFDQFPGVQATSYIVYYKIQANEICGDAQAGKDDLCRPVRDPDQRLLVN